MRAFSLVVVALFLIAMVPQPSHATELPPPTGAVWINGNDDFFRYDSRCPRDDRTGCPGGLGTEQNPWVIDGFWESVGRRDWERHIHVNNGDCDGRGKLAVTVRDTTDHFVIKGLGIEDGCNGIVFENVRNGDILHVEVVGEKGPNVLLVNSHDVLIRDLTSRKITVIDSTDVTVDHVMLTYDPESSGVHNGVVVRGGSDLLVRNVAASAAWADNEVLGTSLVSLVDVSGRNVVDGVEGRIVTPLLATSESGTLTFSNSIIGDGTSQYFDVKLRYPSVFVYDVTLRKHVDVIAMASKDVYQDARENPSLWFRNLIMEDDSNLFLGVGYGRVDGCLVKGMIGGLYHDVRWNDCVFEDATYAGGQSIEIVNSDVTGLFSPHSLTVRDSTILLPRPDVDRLHLDGVRGKLGSPESALGSLIIEGSRISDSVTIEVDLADNVQQATLAHNILDAQLSLANLPQDPSVSMFDNAFLRAAPFDLSRLSYEVAVERTEGTNVLGGDGVGGNFFADYEGRRDGSTSFGSDPYFQDQHPLFAPPQALWAYIEDDGIQLTMTHKGPSSLTMEQMDGFQLEVPSLGRSYQPQSAKFDGNQLKVTFRDDAMGAVQNGNLFVYGGKGAPITMANGQDLASFEIPVRPDSRNWLMKDDVSAYDVEVPLFDWKPIPRIDWTWDQEEQPPEGDDFVFVVPPLSGMEIDWGVEDSDAGNTISLPFFPGLAPGFVVDPPVVSPPSHDPPPQPPNPPSSSESSTSMGLSVDKDKLRIDFDGEVSAQGDLAGAVTVYVDDEEVEVVSVTLCCGASPDKIVVTLADPPGVSSDVVIDFDAPSVGLTVDGTAVPAVEGADVPVEFTIDAVLAPGPPLVLLLFALLVLVRRRS